MSILAHFFGTKRRITPERNNITKIANKVLEERPLRESVPDFETKALAVRKSKGKENCEMNKEKRPLIYNFVLKTKQL